MNTNTKSEFLLFFVFGVSLLCAQDTIPLAITPMNNTGDLPYSTTIGTDIEHVDLASGNLIVTIPFASVPGRKMSFDFGIRFDSRFWTTVSVPSSAESALNPELRNWLTPNTIGWTTTQGYLTYMQGAPATMCSQEEPGGFRNWCSSANKKTYYSGNYIFTDKQGNKHSFYINKATATEPITETTMDSSNDEGPSTAMDGFVASISDDANPTIQGPDGTLYSMGGTSGGKSVVVRGQYFLNYATETDLRGNTQTISPGGTDSIGRTLVREQSSANQIIYSIYDSNGVPQTYTVNLEPIKIATQFGNSVTPEYSAARQTVSSIVLPNQQSYSFQYDTFGDITQIVMPDGATVTYQWATIKLHSSLTVYDVRSVIRRTVMHDGHSDSWTMSYANGVSTRNYTPEIVTVTAPPNSTGVQTQTIYEYDSMEHIRQIQYLASPGGTILRQYDLKYDDSEFIPDPHLLTSIQTTENEMVSQRTFQYDLYGYQTQQLNCIKSYATCLAEANSGTYGPPTYIRPPALLPGSHGNVTTIQEYDWGQGAPGPLIKQTIRTYLQDVNSRYNVNKPISETVYDGSSVCTGTGTWPTSNDGTIIPPPACHANQVAQTTVTYDNGSPSTYGYYGEATTVSHWLNLPSSTMLSTSYAYDGSGNILSQTDPRGNTTTYGYSDSWTGSSACLSTSLSNAYLTSITNALNQKVKQSYYQCTGKIASFQTANDLAAGRTGTTFAYDLMGRTMNVSYPDGGQTVTAYDDTAHTIDIKQYLSSNQVHEVLTQLDNLGREIQTQLLSDPEGVIFTQTAYDALGRKYQVSNPYRSTSDSTYGISTFSYDALGRIKNQIDADGVSTQGWAYNGNAETYSDENGNQWNRTKDALGRLTRVLEPNGSSKTASMETDYAYDALNNLLSVKQCGALCASPATSGPVNRLFQYDSLSRLISATNPETGTVRYSYDANGNVQTRTDARNVVTTYGYDALNRVLSKTYSGDPSNTPFSCYQYDSSSVPNGIGRLANTWTLSASSGASCPTMTPFLTKRSILAYDPMGRITQERQFTLATQAVGTPYSPVYKYDLAGNLISSTSGVGPMPTSTAITLGYAFNGAGRLQTATSNFTGNTVSNAAYTYPTTLFSPPSTSQSSSCENSTSLTSQYSAFGGLMNATFGSGLTLNRTFDNRFRTICEIDMGGVGNATSGSATVTITGAEKAK